MAIDAFLNLTGRSGDFTFHGFEIPEWIKFGGPARLIIHKQPGGTRHIDSMGYDPDPIHWDGIMLTADAGERALRLHGMYVAGDKLTMSYRAASSIGTRSFSTPGFQPSGTPATGEITFTVVISQLKINYKSPNYVEYDIELTEVVSGNTSTTTNTGTGPFQSDLNTLGQNAGNVVA